ncbi:hypothetical protein O0I10_010433 [Lichtheimia ornata]|uniref:LysM domain-containing protein n=1 Tax=Lichtheimia ornata TaxID=688661 RepID=A0AAD7UVS4_9FUNG|nr:uncharacterized protein O0I10_010433 [Lichtheimia ornata]KAJ8653866.1 hypothetical protein O0I10_010433 [Lichtheimia ornata]
MYYPKSFIATALVALQFTTGSNAFFFRNNLEIVHGGANIQQQPEHAASYYSVFARENDPEPEFELVPMSVKDKIVSLKRRAIAGCEEEYTVKRGDTCHEITHKFGIHLEDFYYWNPQVNSRCKNLKPGRKYCVKNSEAGADPDSCNVRHKVVAGDTCTSVAKQYGISHSKFIALNDNITSGCKNLKIGHSYCISTNKESSSNNNDSAAKKKAAEKAAVYEKNDAKEDAKKKEDAEKAAEAKKKAEEAEAAEKKKQEEAEKAAADKKDDSDKIKENVTHLASKTKDDKKDDKKDDDDDDWEKTEVPSKDSDKDDDDKKNDSDSSSSSTEKRKAIHHNIPMTYYWIAMPEDYKQSGKQVSIKTCDGKTLGRTSVEYADALVMEGTGILGDKVVNLGACSCTNYNCFMEVDKKEDPYGLTSYSTALRPFITAAANDIPRGSKVYVPQLDGVMLPTKKKHNGCLLVDDKGWSFSSRHLDFYVYAMKNYETLNSQLGISKVDVYEGGSCKLLDYM